MKARIWNRKKTKEEREKNIDEGANNIRATNLTTAFLVYATTGPAVDADPALAAPAPLLPLPSASGPVAGPRPLLLPPLPLAVLSGAPDFLRALA